MPSATIRLIEEAVESFDGASVYSLGLAEERRDVDEGLALVLSAAEPDLEDAGYCVVAEPGQRTAYRAIASCELEGSILRIRFTECGAADLQLPSEFSLQLAVDGCQLDILERGLARLGVPVDRSA